MRPGSRWRRTSLRRDDGDWYFCPLIFGPPMTQLPPNHETPAAVLAPLARGLMRRAPEILSLSIHDPRGHALWSSGDFLLAEDHALIAEIVQETHDVRGQSSGLWWESADTARARCALA